MLIGLSTSEDGSPTYTIHVLEDWCTDENDENKILITSRDFYHYNTDNNRHTHDISEYVQLIPISRRSIKPNRTYYAVFKVKGKNSSKQKSKKVDHYTSVYYQCKVKEKTSIPATRKTIKIKFFDSNKIYFSRFRGEIKRQVLPVVIDPQPLTGNNVIKFFCFLFVLVFFFILQMRNKKHVTFFCLI